MGWSKVVIFTRYAHGAVVTMTMKTVGGILTWALSLATPAAGQTGGPWAPADTTIFVSGCCTGSDTGAPVLEAVRIESDAISVDGRLDEPAWTRAQVASGFRQFEPADGEPGTERTEARVVYGDAALYVAIRAYDSEPGQIVGQLTRRDQDSYSDLLGVVIDSYFDKRTAFHFAVNPAGVKHDIYRFNDTQEDAGWDAVWDVATSRDDEGWSAEFRIPYSQLRFRDHPEQTWGINFLRTIARKQETQLWALTTRADAAIVSRFGELRGLKNLGAPTRMEMMPYTVARVRRAPGDEANPFYRKNDTFGTVGADLKYGVTSDLTLDVTINPDFGQVEADPAQVNLSAFETFLPERRPFFLEGSSIFNFSIALGDGDQAVESLFYSRRIGRAPQGWADPAGGFTDTDDQTTILGAWKLSGKTATGWSIGAMHAVTAEAGARVAPGVGERYDAPVEPFSNYGVLRIQKDFREGRSAVGFIGTATRRNGEVADQLGLRSSALTGGVDFRHRFGGDSWSVNGYVLGSRVGGSENAIARTQRSPARYFQRPDAKNVVYDPTRTSLTGSSANFSVTKLAGGFWRVGTGVQARSASFETNDLGFLNNAGFLVHWGWLGYHHTTPQGPFRQWFVNLNGWHNYNADWDRTGTGGNVNLNFQFNNFWTGYAGVNREASVLSNGLLRGGPLFRREAQTNFWGGFGSDSRKAVQLRLNSFGNIRSESDSWSLGLSPNIRIRPSGRASFNLGAFTNRNVDDRQWVARVDTEAPSYLFGRIDQTTVGLTARVDYAFTPTLSLQLYAQPFVSAGRYTDFKRVAEPRAKRYADRFELLDPRAEGGRYLTDLDGSGTEESFPNPDFNFKQFRSNAVLRWEYLPGSTLFVVWSQGRDQFTRDGSFDFSGDMGNLFSVTPDNVFMIKLSYWMSR
jgi:Domain of unknown function (DUF5916)